MKSLEIKKIILDFGSTLVNVVIDGADKYIKFDGDITNKDCLIFMIKCCKDSYIECSEFERNMFVDFEDI